MAGTPRGATSPHPANLLASRASRAAEHHEPVVGASTGSVFDDAWGLGGWELTTTGEAEADGHDQAAAKNQALDGLHGYLLRRGPIRRCARV